MAFYGEIWQLTPTKVCLQVSHFAPTFVFDIQKDTP
jgi:hypothetical protein